MNFITPALAAAGLIAMAAPIIIHLLARRRKRPIEWAAMRFLLEAFRKHRRRLRIEQLLLLALRCLALLLLGAALARPFVDAAVGLDAGGSRTVFLVIDNGLASAAQGQTGSSGLQNMLGQAEQIVKALGPGDSIGIITAARPARGLVIPPSTDRNAILTTLRELQPAQSPTDIGGALTILREALGELEPDREAPAAYLLSEFRSGSAPLDLSLPSALIDEEVALFAAAPAETMIANTQIESIDLLRSLVLADSSEGPAQVTVRLARSGGSLPPAVTRVRLAGAGLPLITPQVIQWDAGQPDADIDFMVDFAGLNNESIPLTASIEGDAIDSDNTRHVVVSTRRQIRVLLVDRRSFGANPTADRLRSGQWLHRAIEPIEESPLQVIAADPAALDSPDLRGLDAAVVPRPDLLNDHGWTVLRAYLAEGGVVLFLPPSEVNVHQWTNRLPQDLGLPWRLQLESLQLETPISLADEQPTSELTRVLSGELNDLARPVLTSRYLAIDEAQTRAQPILLFADGAPFVIAGTPRPQPADESDAPAEMMRGMVIYIAAPMDLSWTNLPAKPLMVALVQELIRQAVGLVRTSQQYHVGEQPALGLGAAATGLVDDSGETISLDRNSRPHTPFEQSGVYTVVDRAQQPINQMAVNVDAPSARTDIQSREAVGEWLASSGAWAFVDADAPEATLGQIDAASPIAGILLFALLAIVLLETLLARWFSHASGSDRRDAPMTTVRPQFVGGQLR